MLKCSRTCDNKLYVQTWCDFSRVTIACMKENSMIYSKISFSRKFSPRNRKNLFFGSKMGGQLVHGIDLYTGKCGSSIMPAQVANHNEGFGSSLQLAELTIYCNNSTSLVKSLTRSFKIFKDPLGSSKIFKN